MNRKTILLILALLLVLTSVCVVQWIEAEKAWDEWSRRSGFDRPTAADAVESGADRSSGQFGLSGDEISRRSQSREQASSLSGVSTERATGTSSQQAVEFALSEVSIRIRTSPEFKDPAIIEKEFAPGRWLEVSSRAVAGSATEDDRFSVRLDLQFADGTFFRSETVVALSDDEVRLYLSPMGFRRLSGKDRPGVADIAWLAVTDLVSGRRATLGNPFTKAPKNVPEHEVIRVLTFEDTPFPHQITPSNPARQEEQSALARQ